ncbi:hypothetical protein MTO96_014314 [Rhipicephalus appendiculatus]
MRRKRPVPTVYSKKLKKSRRMRGALQFKEKASQPVPAPDTNNLSSGALADVSIVERKIVGRSGKHLLVDTAARYTSITSSGSSFMASPNEEQDLSDVVSKTYGISMCNGRKDGTFTHGVMGSATSPDGSQSVLKATSWAVAVTPTSTAADTATYERSDHHGGAALERFQYLEKETRSQSRPALTLLRRRGVRKVIEMGVP